MANRLSIHFRCAKNAEHLQSNGDYHPVMETRMPTEFNRSYHKINTTTFAKGTTRVLTLSIFLSLISDSNTPPTCQRKVLIPNLMTSIRRESSGVYHVSLPILTKCT